MSWRSKLTDQRGAAAVEMGLLIIPLVLLVAGILDYGIAFNRQMRATHEVREAVRAAVVGEPAPVSAMGVSVTGCSGANPTNAVATYGPTVYQPIFPMLPSVTLQAKAEMRCESTG